MTKTFVFCGKPNAILRRSDFFRKFVGKDSSVNEKGCVSKARQEKQDNQE